VADAHLHLGSRPVAGVGDDVPAAAAHLPHALSCIRSESPAFDLHRPEAAEAEVAHGDEERTGLRNVLGDTDRHPDSWDR